jgi:LmbE family N-acetylglucosaminyl deacetylase
MHQLVGTVLRLLYGRYVPEPVRSSLALELLLVRHDWGPQSASPPTARRILVLAPHMDDEVFGCGGTLALCADHGSEVTVAYLTDGSKGYAPGLMRGKSPAEIRGLESELTEQRKEEARRAGKILGLSEPIFLDLPDAALAITAAAVDRLLTALQRVRPDVVFLPFMTDVHHDHWITNGLFVETSIRMGLGADVPCWAYEVWTPVVANRVVSVTSVYERKLEAARAFESQASTHDYLRAIEGFNRYRSLLTERGHGYAEAFFTAEFGVYRRLYDRVAVGRPDLIRRGSSASAAGNVRSSL